MKKTVQRSREEVVIEQDMETRKNGHANGHAIGDVNKNTRNGLVNGYHKELVQIQIPELTGPSFPTEWGKTAMTLLYAVCCFILTTVMITIVHERVPPMDLSPPLPDKFFDYFDRVKWAFTVCEINGMVLVILWILQWSLLKHKSIVGRRFLFIVGTLYLYRCVTMYITTLPVPGMHFKCSPKLHGDWQSQMWLVMKMLAGGGLTITGSHHMCDSPRRFWCFHWVCWVLCILGIFCILLAHDHYTIDVVIAYFITTRLFWWYHTMANQPELKAASQTNFLSRVWWFWVFQYMERNVQGVVPRSYHIPFSWRSVSWGHVKYSRIDSD